MRLVRPVRILITLLCGLYALASGHSRQSHQLSSESLKGSIAGIVTIAGKPAVHITVVLILDNNDEPVAARSITDETGHFRFAGTPSGRYLVRAIAPTWAPTEAASADSRGKPISLRDGEELEGVDLSLVRGAVITGRVTDHNGVPVEGEPIALCRVAEDGSKLPCRPYSRAEFATDDRGIYRIYGIPPGRYTVRVGKDRSEMGGFDVGGNFVRTYYPSTTNENQAVAVDLASEREATGIDIVLGKPVSTYRVTGRIVDETTGKPYVPGPEWRGAEVQVVEGSTFESSPFSRFWGLSDDKGKFEILGGVIPGKYTAAVKIDRENSEIYGEALSFEVTDADVTGLELKVRRGSTVSGMIVADGPGDRELLSEKLKSLQILAVPSRQRGADWPSTSPDARKGTVAADGTFRIGGLRPGKIRLGFGRLGNPSIRIVRIEGMSAISGEEHSDSFDVSAASVSGLRVVVAFGSGAISGQINIAGGPLPGGLALVVLFRDQGSEASKAKSAYVDVNGHFSIYGLPAGEHVLEPDLSPSGNSPRAVPQRIRKTGATVKVAEGEKSEVTLMIDLGQTERGKDR